MEYSNAKFKISVSKAITSFRPFRIGNASDRFLPKWTFGFVYTFN